MMLKFKLLVCAMAGVCLVNACATRTGGRQDPAGYGADGTVGAEALLAPADARYQVTPGVDFAHGTPSDGNAIPVYPAELLTARLPPAQVVVRLVVDEEGRVGQASIVEDQNGQPAFADAVLAVVHGWTFLPLRRIENGQATRLPFTQDYRFTFKQFNGRGSVESIVR